MDDKLFSELIDSVGEAGEIRRTKTKPRYIARINGNRPVPKRTTVEVVLRVDDGEKNTGAASSYDWRLLDREYDIIAYRVIEQEKEAL
jgi:hypothetical protein